MTQLIGLICLIMFSWIKVNAFNPCVCSDYGTQQGCIVNFAANCFWENNQCIRTTSNCGQFNNSATCLNPACVWNTTNTSKPVCSTVKSCATINTTLLRPNSCKAFNCAPGANGTQTCSDFINCQSINNTGDCLGSNFGYGKNQGLCQWAPSLIAPYNSSCFAVSQCVGTRMDVCVNLPYCMQVTSRNVTTCADIVCNGFSQSSCTNSGSFCQWKLNNSTNKSSCVTNACNQYGSQATCDNIFNAGFCAFDGKNCKQCFSAGADRVYFALVTTLFIAALTF